MASDSVRLAGDTARESAPAGSSRDDFARLRRRELIEFEIRRSPEAPSAPRHGTES